MNHTRAGALLVALILCSCAEDKQSQDDAAIPGGDGGVTCSDSNRDEDEDGDGILNVDEGCMSGRDTDNDGIPDWQDLDSDDDGVPDIVESGERDGSGKCTRSGPGGGTWPCDSDGDGIPDYLDLDSDGDGLDDGEEDLNGDGLLGCCLTTCGMPGSPDQQTCALNDQGCGDGQTCSNGSCLPSAHLLCSEGETDSRQKDTFADGIPDSARGTFICRDATEDRPEGRKAVALESDTTGDWKVAISPTATYNPLTVAGAGSKTAAATIDYEEIDQRVAGFIVSRAATTDIQSELEGLLAAIGASPLGTSGSATVLGSGSPGKSHDRYDTITSTVLRVDLSPPTDVGTVRNQLVATLLDKKIDELSGLPGPFSSLATTFFIRFTTVRRFTFLEETDPQTGDKALVLDENGDPVDSGDPAGWRLLLIGAVSSAADYQNPARETPIVVDDLSNGTGLALASDQVGNACEVGTIEGAPMADIVWVSDESGSMNDNRSDVVVVANDFFERAVTMGLDFRMGVTNVVPQGAVGFGTFCSRDSADLADSGGVDRFLDPSEKDIFTACIYNPPGYTMGHDPGEFGLINAEAALKSHLPRKPNDVKVFRTDASIVYIILTDQIDASVEQLVGFFGAQQCQLPGMEPQLEAAVQPFVDLFSGAIIPEAVVSRFFVLGGVCGNLCNAHVAYGYREVLQAIGWQIGDVCQTDLGPTLQIFLESIVANASPLKLEHVPISASLAMTIDGASTPRSRVKGFDYNAATNTLLLFDTPYEQGQTTIISYKRWQRQLEIQ